MQMQTTAFSQECLEGIPAQQGCKMIHKAVIQQVQRQYCEDNKNRVMLSLHCRSNSCNVPSQDIYTEPLQKALLYAYDVRTYHNEWSEQIE